MLRQIPPGFARPLVGTVMTGAVLVLSALALGPAGTIALAGGWLLAAGLGRVCPGLDGPASWAAAVVVELSIIGGLSSLLSLLSPQPHVAVLNMAIVAVPAVLGLALVGSSLRRRTRTHVPQVAQRYGLAAAVTAFVVAVTTWVGTRGGAYGVAWAMSGDARNHVRVLRATIFEGGLSLQQLRAYPALVDAMSAVFSMADGRAGLAPGDLMLHDARAMATTYTLALIGVAVLLIAALIEFLPPALAGRRRLPMPLVVVLLGAAATSGSPLVLGTGLSGGFLNAYGSIPPALAAVVLALRLSSRPSPEGYALLGPAIMLTLFGWTVLALVPATATVVVTLSMLLRWRRSTKPAVGPRTLKWALAAVLPIGALLITAGIVVTQRATLKASFLLPGTATLPEPRILPLLAALGLALILLSRSTAERNRLAVAVAVAVAGLAVVYILRALPPGPLVWTYYAVKTLWLVASCLVWVVFLPLLRLVQPGPGAWARFRVSAAAAGLSVAVLVGLGFTTTAPDPVEQAKGGWVQPSAFVIDRAAMAGDVGGPFLLWQWSDPGNDRLANFWAGAIWGTDARGDPTLPDIVSWAYVETDQMSDLCRMAGEAPGLRIITHSAALSHAVEATCPGTGAHVVLDKD